MRLKSTFFEYGFKEGKMCKSDCQEENKKWTKILGSLKYGSNSFM